ncbi:unnamed protein product [Clonostachys rhizophaga]|uniref:Alpha/beta hydrolase fold-3 domain-containing protein n=1 Tax=Clonostachys rhizophaga TaxID=160324 RepID=A0A9N9VBW1_9HYPO|nr:unnamed protein product [Clonostachys rhizophaga]
MLEQEQVPGPLEVRERVNEIIKAVGDALPWPSGMKESTHTARSLDGTTLEIRRFVPRDLLGDSSDSPSERAVIFAFGGGMTAGSVEVFRGFIATIAQQSATQVFAPQWRIAPENPYPAGVEDVYSSMVWLQAHAADFHVDPARLVVFGVSAGGLVAAGAALMARDRQLDPPLAAQCLRYPCLSDQTTVAADDPRLGRFTWSVESNDSAWKIYMGGLEKWERNDENCPIYAVPLRAQNLDGLPPTHIGVGEYDILRDENKEYARRLGEGTELYVYPEMPHGFDANPTLSLGKVMWDREAKFIQRF